MPGYPRFLSLAILASPFIVAPLWGPDAYAEDTPAAAQKEPAIPDAALPALEKLAADRIAANEAHKAALNKAHQDAVDTLAAALKKVMMDGNLDAANAIKGWKDKTEVQQRDGCAAPVVRPVNTADLAFPALDQLAKEKILANNIRKAALIKAHEDGGVGLNAAIKKVLAGGDLDTANALKQCKDRVAAQLREVQAARADGVVEKTVPGKKADKTATAKEEKKGPDPVLDLTDPPTVRKLIVGKWLLDCEGHNVEEEFFSDGRAKQHWPGAAPALQENGTWQVGDDGIITADYQGTDGKTRWSFTRKYRLTSKTDGVAVDVSAKGEREVSRTITRQPLDVLDAPTKKEKEGDKPAAARVPVFSGKTYNMRWQNYRYRVTFNTDGSTRSTNSAWDAKRWVIRNGRLFVIRSSQEVFPVDVLENGRKLKTAADEGEIAE